MRSIIAFVLLLLIASISCIFNVKKSGKESDRTTEGNIEKTEGDIEVKGGDIENLERDIEVAEGDIGTTYRWEVTEVDKGMTEGDVEKT